MRYIALLRGINVGGNNKIAMSELKECFEQIGFTNVKTYINSGNVIFEANQSEIIKLIQKCEAAIADRFSLNIACAVITASELQEVLDNAPSWWDNNEDSKHNAIFVIHPVKASEIMSEVGEAKHEYERVASHGSVIFWSADVATFSRTRYSKIVGTNAYKSVTIRNANTTKKIAALCAAQ